VTDYQGFARFYDRLMVDLQQRHGQDGDRFSGRVRECISRYMPGASSLLDLGCGTGTLLAGLPELPSLTGLDLSPAMLAVARPKVPSATFIQGDMSAFDLGKQFDVVTCVFDTLNHLTAFDRWIALFECAHTHLTDGGIFIFDVVTVQAFRRISESPPSLHDFDGNTLLATVGFTDDNISVRDIRIFEHLEGDRFILHRERICELGVPIDLITGALASRFEIIEAADQTGDSPGDKSDRVYFAAAKR